MPEESELLTSPFKKEKLFYLLRHLKISRASLLVGDDTFEFIDTSNKAILEYQLFRSGNTPTNFRVEHVKDKCPVCGEKVIFFDSDEDTAEHITVDYKCPECNFIGTMWFHKTFVGHTSSVYNHTIESYRTKINN